MGSGCLDLGQEVASFVIEPSALFLAENPRKAVDRAERRSQIVRNRVAERLELLVGRFERCA